MAKYTMTLAEVLNLGDIFDFPYDIPAQHKATFEERFKDFYMFHEIAFVNSDEFKHYLKNTVQINARKYSELYRTAMLDVDIVNNYDMTETSTREVNGTNDTVNDNNDVTRNILRDTPQGRIENVELYATEVTDNEVTSAGTSTATTAQTETNTLTRKGNIGVMTVSDMIAKYRETLLSVDQLFINECRDLFMLIY